MTDYQMDKVYNWWKGLTEEKQLKIMTDYYPTEVNKDTNIDKMFGDMPTETQLWIWKTEIGTDEVYDYEL